MGEYLAPGVFVEEIDGGSKPIEGVGINTAAFIGYAKSGDFNTPTFVTNWTQFCQQFGENEVAYLDALNAETGKSHGELLMLKKASKKSWPDYARFELEKAETNVSARASVWPSFVSKYQKTGILESTPYMEDSYLAYAVRGYYDNGGGRAYIVRVARPEDLEVLAQGNSNVSASNGTPKAESKPATSALGPLTVRALNAGPEGNSLKIEVEHVGDKDDFRVKLSGLGEDEFFPKDPGQGASSDQIINAINSHSKMARAEAVKPENAPKGVKIKNRPDAQVFTFTGGATQTAIVSSKNGAVQSAAARKAEELLARTEANDWIGDEAKRSGAKGLAILEDINMICAPDLMAGLYKREINVIEGARGKTVTVGIEDVDQELYSARKDEILAAQCNIVAFCETMGDRMAILDPMPYLRPLEMKDMALETPWNSDHGQGTLYYPWIKVADPLYKGKTRLVPPSGHIAGVWARVGTERGVHKAPANEALMGTVALEYDITKGEQEILNPIGVNCIRSFPGQGIRVWGARTLATVGNPSWKYVNVRRLFNYLERSMDRGLQWVVFEPNDPDLWGRVRRNLSAFLFTEWKEGKLFGATPDQAFYVKCNAETNPQEMIDLGRLYVEIGINPVKPAEFVIVRIGQWSGGASTSEG